MSSFCKNTLCQQKLAELSNCLMMTQRQSCSAFNCLSSAMNISAGGRPLPPEILPPSDLPTPANGILWEMSELVTQERIAVESSNFVEGLNTWPAMYVHWPKSKGQRSRSQGHVHISSNNAITGQRMVVSTSNLVETVTARCASRDTLSRSVGQLERK